MKPAKMPPMVAEISRTKRPVGRPRKYSGESVPFNVRFPRDIADAIEAHSQREKIFDRSEALRRLVREAAEARQLVERRGK